MSKLKYLHFRLISNMTTLMNKNWLKDPLTAHNVDNIKNEKIFV